MGNIEKGRHGLAGSGLAKASPSVHGVIPQKLVKNAHGWAAEVGAIQAN
jgi:hypothetical protein